MVRKEDVIVAKNYLNNDELDTLNRLVTVFLESAELRVKGRQDITISFRKETVDRVLMSNDKDVLDKHGAISHEIMQEKITALYQEYDSRRKIVEAQQADEDDLLELEDIVGQK